MHQSQLETLGVSARVNGVSDDGLKAHPECIACFRSMKIANSGQQ